MFGIVERRPTFWFQQGGGHERRPGYKSGKSNTAGFEQSRNFFDGLLPLVVRLKVIERPQGENGIERSIVQMPQVPRVQDFNSLDVRGDSRFLNLFSCQSHLLRR